MQRISFPYDMFTGSFVNQENKICYLVVGTGLPWAAQKILIGCPTCRPIVRLKSSDVNLGDLAPTGSGIDGDWMRA